MIAKHLLFLAVLASGHLNSPVEVADAAEGEVTFQDVSELLGPYEGSPPSHWKSIATGQGPFTPGLEGLLWFDFDNDGDLDLFVCRTRNHDLSFGDDAGTNSLFQNDGSGNFVDVMPILNSPDLANNPCNTVVVGDLDNDGHKDLVMYGDIVNNSIFWFRNTGNGESFTLEKSARYIETPNPKLVPFALALADYDGDGDLDLLVGFAGRTDMLWRNDWSSTGSLGDWVDVSSESGVADNSEPITCSMVFADFNGDQLPDILMGKCVTLVPKELILQTNNGNGTFSSAVIPMLPGFYMGLSVGDIDGDGDLDIFTTSVGTTVFDSPHILLINDGLGNFDGGFAPSDFVNTEFGWSNAFVDFTNDGDLDLLYIGSGFAHPFWINFGKGRLYFNDGSGSFDEAAFCGPPDCTQCTTALAVPLGVRSEPNLCFSPTGCESRDPNSGNWSDPSFEYCNSIPAWCDGCFPTSPCAMDVEEVKQCVPALGVDLSTTRNTQMAVGDFDGDGFEDVAIATNNYSSDYPFAFNGTLAPEGYLMQGAITHLILLKNNANTNNYVRLQLVGSTGNRDGVGSILTLNGGEQHHWVQAPTGTFAPTTAFPAFGLGQRDSPVDVEVKWWPSGKKEKFCGLAVNTMSVLEEGNGVSADDPCPSPDIDGNTDLTAPQSGGISHGALLVAFALEQLLVAALL